MLFSVLVAALVLKIAYFLCFFFLLFYRIFSVQFAITHRNLLAYCLYVKPPVCVNGFKIPLAHKSKQMERKCEREKISKIYKIQI